ncbi:MULTISPECIES: protein kinase [unclassified Streptomyces]|uniref:protein kinase n=1 Tax=unclassified Streptomyces TaxID=2593676 RepID=UPI002E27D869|nr:protein kinase [Streptomyces sp. NBC_00223]
MNPGPELRALIRPHAGEVSEIRPTTYGYSSDLTAVIECEKGPFFVKVMRNRPGGWRDSIVREKLINPFVQPISPALRWVAEDEEWIVLGFEAVEGRASDFRPDSADLPTVVELINAVAELPFPSVARDWPETRWDRFAADAAETELFRGDALLHTDINPDNVLIGGRNGWMVDWSWPTRGAAFIDPACLVVQLISSEHSAEEAEGWAARCLAWKEADPRAIDVFAAANLRMMRRFAERRPDEEWRGAMAAAARAWVDHRGVTVA